MAESFFFYDLETSGFSPREGRIMQFGGQRTDLELRHIGEPISVLIKMTNDTLPDPDAVLVTGITPQKTINEGITEAEFLKIFNSRINTAGTTFVGFNNIRFDDEFMRFLQYRNLYEPYVWQWKEGRSRWDILDLVRMTRALRPDGIKWPFDEAGRPTNRLELLAAKNNLQHSKAHDALSDVLATIEVARLLKEKQPKLFDFSYQHRDKKAVANLVETQKMFIYTSGKYPSEFEKTTIVRAIAEHPRRQGVLVYDLRRDPKYFSAFSPKQLAAAWQYRGDNETERLPVKTLLFNRCPAVAPLSVLDKTSQKRLKINLEEIQANQAALATMNDFPKKVVEALSLLDDKRDQKSKNPHNILVDAQLYDSFFSSVDSEKIHKIHETDPSEISSISGSLGDSRFDKLFPLFIARNYPEVLNTSQHRAWEKYRKDVLTSGDADSRLSKYFKRLEDLSTTKGLSKSQKYLVEELQLWGESVIPADGDD